MIILVPILLAVFPIKFTYNPINKNDKKDFYLAVCVSEGSTDAGSWIIIGNQNEMWNEGLPVYFTGKNPNDLLSYDICNNYTQFAIYGSLLKDSDETFYTLNCDKWKMFGEVKRGNHCYRLPFKHFITLYDLKWFDFFLTDNGYD